MVSNLNGQSGQETTDSARPSKGKLTITKITLNDSTLINSISRFIKFVKQNNSDFNKWGYIELVLLGKSCENLPDSIGCKSVVRSFYYNVNASRIRPNDLENKYPLFYSYVANRLVLVYIEGFRNVSEYSFTAKDKKRFRKLVDQYLEKPLKITAYDEKGNIKFIDKKFSLDFSWSKGQYLYQLNNRGYLELPARY
jgi:hypothetical protein